MLISILLLIAASIMTTQISITAPNSPIRTELREMVRKFPSLVETILSFLARQIMFVNQDVLQIVITSLQVGGTPVAYLLLLGFYSWSDFKVTSRV